MRKITILVGVALLLIPTIPASGQNIELPFRGVVSAEPKVAVRVRVGPPKVTPLSYELAKPVGSAGNGSEFVATQEFLSLNGEIWFHVVFTELENAEDVQTGQSYWIVGKLKSGWVVNIREQGIAVDEIPRTTGGVSETLGVVLEGSISIVWNYLLLLIGTLLGVVVIRIEGSQSIKPKEWYHPFLFWQFALLSAINILVVIIILKEFDGKDELFVGILQKLYVVPGGSLLLGFILATLFLSFIAFAKNRQVL